MSTNFVLSLIALTVGLQERGCLGILYRQALCSRVLFRRNPYPCILFLPNCFSGILHGPYFCMRAITMEGRPDISRLLHRPERWSGFFGNLCPRIFRRGIMNG